MLIKLLIISILLLSIMLVFFIITARNIVYAVLSMILLFITISFFLLMVGCEFLAFIYIIVYVGAVLVLFLWVVMTIPLKKSIVYQSITNPILLLIFTFGILGGVYCIFINLESSIPLNETLFNLPVSFKTYKELEKLLNPDDMFFMKRNSDSILKNYITPTPTLLFLTLFPCKLNTISWPGLQQVLYIYEDYGFSPLSNISESLIFLSIFPDLPHHYCIKILEAAAKRFFINHKLFIPSSINLLQSSNCFFLTIMPFNPNKSHIFTLQRFFDFYIFNKQKFGNFIAFINNIKQLKQFYLINLSPCLFFSINPINFSKYYINFPLFFYSQFTSLFDVFYYSLYKTCTMSSPLFFLSIGSDPSIKFVSGTNDILLLDKMTRFLYHNSRSILKFLPSLLIFESIMPCKPNSYCFNIFFMVLNNFTTKSVQLLKLQPSLISLSLIPCDLEVGQVVNNYKKILTIFSNKEALDRYGLSYLYVLSLNPNCRLTRHGSSIYYLLFKFMQRNDLIYLVRLFSNIIPTSPNSSALHDIVNQTKTTPALKLLMHDLVTLINIYNYLLKHQFDFIPSVYWIDSVLSNENWFSKNLGESVYLFLSESIVLSAFLLLSVIVGAIGLVKLLKLFPISTHFSKINEHSKSNN